MEEEGFWAVELFECFEDSDPSREGIRSVEIEEVTGDSEGCSFACPSSFVVLVVGFEGQGFRSRGPEGVRP